MEIMLKTCEWKICEGNSNFFINNFFCYVLRSAMICVLIFKSLWMSNRSTWSDPHRTWWVCLDSTCEVPDSSWSPSSDPSAGQRTCVRAFHLRPRLDHRRCRRLSGWAALIFCCTMTNLSCSMSCGWRFYLNRSYLWNMRMRNLTLVKTKSKSQNLVFRPSRNSLCFSSNSRIMCELAKFLLGTQMLWLESYPFHLLQNRCASVKNS